MLRQTACLNVWKFSRVHDYNQENVLSYLLLSARLSCATIINIGTLFFRCTSQPDMILTFYNHMLIFFCLNLIKAICSRSRDKADMGVKKIDYFHVKSFGK
jgi:hypothetical protein